MRIGISVPTVDRSGHVLDAHGVAVRSHMVEAAGFDAIWKGDGSYYRGWSTEADPLAWCLAALVSTERIEVGTAVYQIAVREPVDVAQRIMTIEALAPGRFTCGVGAGSTESAFSAVGVAFEHRFRVLNANMDSIRRLLRGEVVGDANLSPWPSVRGGPRFVLGAWGSERSIRRAALDYDGWMYSARRAKLDEAGDAIKRYRDMGGKRVLLTTCAIDLRATATKVETDHGFDLLCGPSEAVDRIGRLVDLGFDDLALRFESGPPTPTGEPGDRDFTVDDLEEIRALVP